jgi:polyhydroxyalkanoate synthesis regulator phasin
LQYVKDIEELHQQLHAVNVDWIKSQDEIQTLRERIRALRNE